MKSTPLAEWLLAQGLTSDAGQRNAMPMNRRLFERIREAILHGQLQPGQKLPASRELANELGVGRNTVMHAYERLDDEGYTASQVGSGTFVNNTVPDPTVLPRLQQASDPRTLTQQASPASALSDRALRLIARAGASEYQVGAFVPGVPDVAHFPHAIWNRLVAKTCRNPSADLMGYGSSRGYPPLKRALAEYLRLARGVRCDDDQVVITQGAHQALDLCARVLADPGDEAWIEDPCYWGARSVFDAAGLKLRAIPVDQDGLLPPAQGATQKGEPRIIFVTPSHQYPSGVVMSLARRRLLLEIARRAGAWIIEDDYDSEFRYRNLPLPSLQGLDAHGRTIYIGSFSKSLYPGLRLGFMVLPEPLVDAFTRSQSELYRGGHLLLQSALAEFIRDGHYAAHVRRMRKIYGQRQALLAAELKRQLGGRGRVLGSEAGLHLTFALNDATDTAVEATALERGIIARPLSPYYALPEFAPHGLVLGYGDVADERIKPAVATLAAALDAADAQKHRHHRQ
jgi:GntR family transcriptional regulator/MocR family aminotransferase